MHSVSKQYTRAVKNHVLVYYINAEKWAVEAQSILQGLLIKIFFHKGYGWFIILLGSTNHYKPSLNWIGLGWAVIQV